MAIRIAYLILAHKCPPQVARLVHRLQGPNRTFVVHVDRKSDLGEWELARASLRQPNVFWADRVACAWGDFSLVEATLNCIGLLLKAAPPADFVVLLSGQDYPIKSNEYLEEFLTSRRDECLMYFHHFPYPDWPRRGYYRLPTWRVPIAGKKRRIVPPLLAPHLHRWVPRGYHPCGGSQWWALPGRVVEYVWHFLHTNPEFLAYFKDALFPDEMIFHTVIGNSPFPVTVGDHHLHYMRWIGAASPAVLTPSELPALSATPKCFARKFACETGDKLLDLVDEKVLGLPPYREFEVPTP